jgi:hypothetical protein
MTFAEALARLDAPDLFADEPAREYRRLARALHPDHNPPHRQFEATAAFQRLSKLWEARGATVFVRGDIANLYERGPLLEKVARRPVDNDLLEREATVLRRLAGDVEPKYRAYLPELVDSYALEDPATGARRRVNVLRRLAGFVSLADVARAYPGGVDPRDVAWMWRRLLVAIGLAHRAGLVHGAVLPEHVLIEPAQHGLVLVDWCYAVESGQKVPALVGRHRDRYPPEVPAKEPATSATDIYLATECVRRLMGAKAHPALLRFARGCALRTQRLRPQHAHLLLRELDEQLHKLYGPRRFRPFSVPRV